MAPPARPTGPDRSADHQRLLAFLDHCHQRLVAMALHRPDDDPVRRAADALAGALDRACPRPFEPTRVPVVDSIDQLPIDERNRALVGEFLGLVDGLPWVPTPRADDGGHRLALAPLNQAVDFGDTTVGLMYVGPGATYPLHHHPPQELYLTIAGTGRWRYGGREQHETVGPLATLYNHPEDRHSVTAGTHPLLALYVLW